MLIDAFTFFDEVDMLEFRLQMLWPVVDKFIIVEADHTFSGKKKALNFLLNSEKFAWAKEKIVYHAVAINPNIPLDMPPPTTYDTTHPCWRIEYCQRNSIKDALVDFRGSDFVMIGDVDEIPSREAITYAIDNKVFANSPVVFRQSMFYYNLKFLRKEMWHGTIITNVSTIREVGAQSVRDQRNILPNAITNSGWHLSFFSSPDKIRHKVESFSHQELNKEEFKNQDHILHCMATGEDLFDRDVPVMSVQKDQFPKYFQEFSNKEWW